MNPKAKIIDGKVHIILSKRMSKVLGLMGDYSSSISQDIANNFDESVWFKYSGEEVRKLMKGIHWALVDLFDDIEQSESRINIRKKEEQEVSKC